MRWSLLSSSLLGCCLLLAAVADAYYVPGTYPQEYSVGDVLQANVNSLSSFDTDLPFEYYTMPFCKPPEGVQRIANTANPGTILQGLRIENSPYRFTMKIKQSGVKACKDKGYYGPLTKKEVELLKSKIDNHYRVNMLLDNLPVTVYDLLDKDQEFVRPGFELGYRQNGKYYIHNHLVFNILVYLTHGEYTAAKKKYNDALAMEAMDARRRLLASGRRLSGGLAASILGSETASDLPGAVPEQQHAAGGQADGAEILRRAAAMGGGGAARRGLLQNAADAAEAAEAEAAVLAESAMYAPGKEPYYMVVGFEVSPCSVHREPNKDIEDIVCGVDNDAHVPPQEIYEGAMIVYTYDTYWQDSKIKWASRWDAYLRMPGGKVHWFSIMNSMLVVLVMATIVGMILVRTVRRDLAKYEQLVVEGNSMDMKDEAGWKLVSGDVFRAPTHGKMLAVQFGSGVQIIATFTVTLGLATLGFLSPASRGALITTTMVLYILLAVLAGFSATLLWGCMERTYQGWVGVCMQLALYYPAILMAIFTLLNLVIHHTGSTGAVPIGMYFSLVAVWFLVSIPLTFAGGLLAIKMPMVEYPVKTNQIPRHIPPPPLAANPSLLFFAAGILPFGTIFIELYFAMTSLWLGYFYYLFGFVFVIFALTVIINAEIAVLCTYVQLCAEDYLWWWSSFQRGGSVAFYLSLYALGFLVSTMTTLVGGIPVLIYLSYMAITVLGFYLAMGTVGFGASFGFVYWIFKAVKQD